MTACYSIAWKYQNLFNQPSKRYSDYFQLCIITGNTADKYILNIMLSERRQTRKARYCMHQYIYMKCPGQANS